MRRRKEITIDTGNSKHEAYADEVLRFTWSAKDAVAMLFNGFNINPQSRYFDFEFPEPGENVYSLQWKDGAGVIHKLEARVTVHPVPTVGVAIGPSPRRENEGVWLVWEAEHVKSLDLVYPSGKREELNIDDMEKFIPAADATEGTYTIEAKGELGNRKFHFEIELNGACHAQAEFAADKLCTLPGVPVKLTWEVTNAKKIWIDDIGEVESRGERSVSPSESRSYTLHIVDDYCETERKVYIEVAKMPLITQLYVPNPALEQTTKLTIHAPRFRPKQHFTRLRIQQLHTGPDYAAFLDELNAQPGLMPVETYRTMTSKWIIPMLKKLRKHHE